MTKRPTIADLARASGVSVATVDRVLNGRHPVREETARRVYDAAKTIGYHAVGLLRQRVFEDLPQYRLGFLLQKPEQSFYKALAKEIENAALSVTHVRAIAQVDFVASSTPSAIVDKLKTIAARNQAIALVSPDYPAVTAAIEELKERGIPVFALLSDFAAGVREGYIGLNNQKVGRTAAWMIAKAAKRPGKVAVFVGSHRFHGHELREIGFRSYFRENAPDFEVLDTMVNLDTPEITHEATLDLLQRHPDLLGFYVCGGGMEGAISAIREEKLGGKLLAVVNELTPESRAALADEMVLMAVSTPVAALARETIDLMVGAIDRGASSVPGQTFLPFDIYTPENI
ncbi:LacI family DNA-binding transcriptional regulator [Sinorhizobium meliloti]|uniref:LacI family DNA-binding transcriptional regulator n=1 Tax=Rhizobium meliloti TaxID=382 RepID=UPI000FD72C02|nr:LacI family DNA-binding transcriptional regulator [Sinorhizobium meliloti]QGJ78482.1 LacI family transcriptional regulator [Sinorhizobium meliloti]RVH04141.1 LacI family DNA-binding transcriptional regulator [Sinorhizobium meliloti]RVK46649.1 LacI family DNA-binding transcriptional regulator [Sinorhizobium meliloti]RVM71306.1 LacI family DNA-binding transcriptional regulator [Sinorhizobium meliloti]RVM82686.1 LacI family DNA-binding transcriptional regulator [Sinorhizobium meliloti]